MASTYTAAGIELITTGEQSGTWGATTNTNLELIEELAVGVVSVALTGTTYTLTTTDGTSSEGRHAVVVFSGSPGGTCTVTVSPNDMQRVYFVKNGSDQTVTLTQGSGGNVNVASGDSAIVYCDGAGASAAVVDFTSTLNFQAYDANLTSFLSALDLPTVDGTSGQVLQTNGSGTLSFGDKTSLATPVAVTGSATAGAEIRLPEDTDNGSNYVALKAADTIASNVTFTLPAADGSSGEALVTDGSGTLSFGSAGISTGKSIAMAIVFG